MTVPLLLFFSCRFQQCHNQKVCGTAGCGAAGGVGGGGAAAAAAAAGVSHCDACMNIMWGLARGLHRDNGKEHGNYYNG